MLNESHYFKNKSTSSITIIIIIITKYPKNFVYPLIITKIILVTSLVLILVGGKRKPIIKSIINSNISLCGIGSTNNLPYKQCLDIYTL
jgi:NAD/NADP transhydrogenase beta subunit